MANSFPGSGLVYVDQLAVGRSSGTSLINSYLADDLNTIQIRAESNTSGVVSYTGIAPAYLEYYRNVATGVDLTIQTKIQAAGGGGSIVFSPNSPSADLTPVERMRITKGGSVGIGTASPGTNLEVFGTDAEMMVHYTGNSRGGFRAMSTQRLAILTTSSSDSLVFGYETDFKSTFTERMRINNSTGNVGIGTTTPSSSLSVASSGANGILLDQNLSDATTSARVFFKNNSSGIAMLYDAVGLNFCVGAIAGTTSGTTKVTINNSGSVCINTTSAGTYKLNVNGTFYSAGSSLEYKTEISTLDIDTNKILELRPVTYQYKDEYKHLGKELKSGTQIGLIAEEVAEVFPELALLKEDEDGETRVRNVDYEKLSILLLSEVQKLRKEVNELKKK